MTNILDISDPPRGIPIFFKGKDRKQQIDIARDVPRAVRTPGPELRAYIIDDPHAAAMKLHRRGVRVIYYISPQLWAWRSYRARNISRDVDLLLSILPFEKDWYAARGITNVQYVGHPLTGEVRAS